MGRRMALSTRQVYQLSVLLVSGLAVAAMPCLVSCGGRTQAPTVSKTGATHGLEALRKSVDVNGIKTWFYEAGQGEPMVLVHGGGFNGRYSGNHWDKVIIGLSKRFRVFAVDKLASGMTDNPRDDKDYNIGGEVEHMYQFIQTMKLGKVHLVGQSRGSGLSLVLAVEHPEVVKTLVLIDSGTASPDDACPGCREQFVLAPCPGDFNELEPWKCVMRHLSFKPDVAFDEDYWAAAAYMARLPKSKETVAKKAAGAGGPGTNGFIHGVPYAEYKQKMYERLRSEFVLPMPILLYWAKNDPQAPALKNGVALYEILAEKHPNVRLLVINNGGHFFWRVYPDEFTHNLISFIDYWGRQPTETTAKAPR